MSLCASCGLHLHGEVGLCPHHHVVYGGDWALANRIMCDFFHRHRVPRRLTKAERADDIDAMTVDFETSPASGFAVWNDERGRPTLH